VELKWWMKNEREFPEWWIKLTIHHVYVILYGNGGKKLSCVNFKAIDEREKLIIWE
jgi:hypothetical protein